MRALRPMLHTTRPTAATCALALLTGPALAQEDPRPEPTLIRTVLHGDRTPMPGVTIGLLPRNFQRPAAVRDGWLIATHPRLSEQQAAEYRTSNPTGAIPLRSPADLADRELFVAPPYRLRSKAMALGELQLHVERQQQFVVHVTRADGSAWANQPLELRNDNQVESVAWTDARGRALFGVDPHITVRLRVVPVGWLGPIDSFPTTAAGLADRSAKLRLPPCGTVRVRTLRAGVATPSAWLLATHGEVTMRRLHHIEPGLACHGVEIGPVAVGTGVRGTLQVTSDARPVPFASDGPTADGQLLVLDVETAPLQPQLAFRLPADLERPVAGRRARLHVSAVTDAGSFHDLLDPAPVGSCVATFAWQPLRGHRLLRVDLDLLNDDSEGGGELFCASVPVDQPLVAGALQLGDLALARHAPLLRGRVVDGDGQPIAGAMITVQADAERVWQQANGQTGPDGRFCVLGPLLRGHDGALLPIRAFARKSDERKSIESPASASLAPGGELELVLAQPGRGELTLGMRGLLPVARPLLTFALVDEHRVSRELIHSQVQWSADRQQVRLGPVPAGRFELRIVMRPSIELQRFPDVQVAAGGVTDPRLRDIDLSGLLRSARLRIVDQSGIPLGQASVTYEGPGGDVALHGHNTSDGRIEVVFGPPSLRITVGAPGMAPRQLRAIIDGSDVRLHSARTLPITVSGLPADLPRQQLRVLLRPVVRELLNDVVDAPIDADGCAHVPWPNAGQYLVRIVIEQPNEGGGRVLTMVWESPHPILVQKDAADPCQCTLDDAARERLQQLLAK